MNQTEKKKTLDELRSKYKRMMEAHSKKVYVSSEGAHFAEATAIKAVYQELYDISLESNEPVPFWF
tara:strand:+ start:575 stop:772 length:198 start_codon:yes stop_codon:yes gene_type:complete